MSVIFENKFYSCSTSAFFHPKSLEFGSYRGENDNNAENGLLLRSDIHTLFDLDLLGIEPESLRVELHPDLAEEYGRFADVTLPCAGHQRPSREALRLRYERYYQRCRRPA